MKLGIIKVQGHIVQGLPHRLLQAGAFDAYMRFRILAYIEKCSCAWSKFQLIGFN